MMPTSFDPGRFRIHLNDTIEKVKLILEANRIISKVEDVDHSYDDKYHLANILVNSANTLLNSVFEEVGLTPDILKQLVHWAETRDVSLRFESVEQCDYEGETKRKEEDPNSSETKIKSPFGSTSITSKTYTTITEYNYLFSLEYQLIAFRGVGERDEDKITLLTRKSNQKLVLRAKSSPFPAITKRPTIDVNVSWLLRTLNTFSINRIHKECYTPRRNHDIESGLIFYRALYDWSHQIENYFIYTIFPVPRNYTVPPGTTFPDLSYLNDVDSLFVPVVPLFEEPTTTTIGVDPSTTIESIIEVGDEENENDTTTTTTVTTTNDNTSIISANPSSTTRQVLLDKPTMTIFINEGHRVLEEKINTLSTIYPTTNDAFINIIDGKIVIAMRYIMEISIQVFHSIQYIEVLLYEQLVKAIGRTVQPADFNEYMKYHNRKLFKSKYTLTPFSYAIRRSSQHSPEGVIRFEEIITNSTTNAITYESIPTITAYQSSETALPMEFSISASTKITFYGDRYIHGIIRHEFETTASDDYRNSFLRTYNGVTDSTPPPIQLVCEAKQFSSYIVMLGTLASSSVFDPKYAMIIQNKDTLNIPIECETIPTPKEFKDAIKSLSPEQQRFAQAYRSMQLQGTLFAILIIQIKPQLEKVLNLTSESLTKEIKLTQDLMNLFITYQIPTDLLTFDATMYHDKVDSSGQLLAVKNHVQAIKEMIEASKKEEIEARKLEELYQHPIVNEMAMMDEYAYNNREEERSMMKEMIAPSARMKVMKKSSAPMRSLSTFSSSGSSSAAPPPMKMMSYAMESCAPPPPPPAPCAAPMMNMAVPAPGGPGIGGIGAFGGGITLSTSQPTTALHQPTIDHTTVIGNKLSPRKKRPIEHEHDENDDEDEDIGDKSSVDYTALPILLDTAYVKYDVDSALKPTILKPSNTWTKKSQKALLEAPKTSNLSSDDLDKCKNATFDLLDALTCSGGLDIEHASLHIVLAATHNFDHSIMDTIIQRNINPIERVERSTLIMASILHGESAEALVQPNQVERVQTYSPMLFIDK